jgi:tetratricopeptide (TPR) repeat protein
MWQEALAELRQAYLEGTSPPRKAEALYWIAMAELAAGRYEDSVRAMDELQRLAPGDTRYAEVPYHRGRVYYYLGRYDDAIVLFRTFLDSIAVDVPGENARRPAALYWMGECLYALGQLDRSREIFSLVVEQYPHSVKYEASSYRLALINQKRIEAELLSILKWSHEESLRTVEEYQRRERSYDQAIIAYQRRIAGLLQDDRAARLEEENAGLRRRLAEAEEQAAWLESQLEEQENSRIGAALPESAPSAPEPAWTAMPPPATPSLATPHPATPYPATPVPDTATPAPAAPDMARLPEARPPVNMNTSPAVSPVAASPAPAARAAAPYPATPYSATPLPRDVAAPVPAPVRSPLHPGTRENNAAYVDSTPRAETPRTPAPITEAPGGRSTAGENRAAVPALSPPVRSPAVSSPAPEAPPPDAPPRDAAGSPAPAPSYTPLTYPHMRENAAAPAWDTPSSVHPDSLPPQAAERVLLQEAAPPVTERTALPAPAHRASAGTGFTPESMPPPPEDEFAALPDFEPASSPPAVSPPAVSVPARTPLPHTPAERMGQVRSEALDLINGLEAELNSRSSGGGGRY